MANDKNIDKDSVAASIKAFASEFAQQIGQQIAEQTSQSVQQAIQKLQGSTQEKSNVVDAVTQNKQEEINTGEAFRSNVYTQTRVHDFNMKMLTAKELEFDLALKAAQLKDKELEIARKQHDLSHAQKMDMQNLSVKQYLDQISVQNAQNGANFDTAVKFEYAKFNAAISEPLSPDSGSDTKDASK